MYKMQWYKTAAQSLGIQSLVRRQLQKRFTKKGLMRLTSKLLPHPVYARTCTSDLNVFDQIMVERQYRCLEYVKDPGLIVDLGANVGYSSAYFLSRYPSSTVLAVEPDPSNYALLVKNLEPYGDRCVAVRAAVWPTSEPTLQFKGASIAGEEWARTVELGSQAEIKAITVPQLLKMAGSFQKVSILKIDIEGSEVELFSGDTTWLDQVDNIVIELHNEKCSAVFAKAVARFRPKASSYGELTCCALNQFD